MSELEMNAKLQYDLIRRSVLKVVMRFLCQPERQHKLGVATLKHIADNKFSKANINAPSGLRKEKSHSSSFDDQLVAVSKFTINFVIY